MKLLKNMLILNIIILILSCKTDKNIIARVNKEILTKQDLITLKIEEKNKRNFINDWINFKLLSNSVNDNELINLKANNYKTKLKANIYISKLFEKEEVAQNELINYYNANYQNFYKQITKYKFQKIYVSTKSKKNELVKEISKITGIKFSDLAKKYSEDIYGKNGGYTGFVDEESIRPLVWQKLTNSEKGKYYWIDVPDGYVIGRWYEKKEFKIQLSFEQVKNEIKKIIKQADRQKIIEKELQKLRKEKKVEINLDYN